MSASSSVKTGIQARMNRIEQRDRVKQSKTRKPINLLRWVILIACVLFAILILSPLFLMVLNAFKTSQDYTQNGPLSLPHELYFGGLVNFWKATDFPIKFWNSLWISVVSALLSVVLSLFNAYALGIGRVRGSSVIIALFMILTMLPGEGFIYTVLHVQRGGHGQFSMDHRNYMRHYQYGVWHIFAQLGDVDIPQGAVGSCTNRRGWSLAHTP